VRYCRNCPGYFVTASKVDDVPLFLADAPDFVKHKTGGDTSGATPPDPVAPQPNLLKNYPIILVGYRQKLKPPTIYSGFN